MKQQGFTLIELVIVIVILGVLAAVAVPRFVNIQQDARIAVMNGVAASVASAANLVHAKYVAQGSTGSVSVEGNTVTLTNDYPAATATGIVAALQKLSPNITSAADGSNWKFSYNGKAACAVTYTAPTAAGDAPDVDTTAINTTNC